MAQAPGSKTGKWIERAQNAPPLVWIVLGFAVSYLVFFLYPIFLSGPAMHTPAAVPAIPPSGTDLKQTSIAARAWLETGGSPYARAVWYPPLAYMLIAPFLLLPFSVRYIVVTALTVLAYALNALVLPMRLNATRAAAPGLLLVLATGAVSYGLQFEIERGQLNVIAALLTLTAIWIYHAHPRRRAWGYVLFCAAVQLKLWPCFFVVLFIHDHRDWAANLRRLALLGLANLALLLVFSPGPAVADLLRAFQTEAARADLMWIGNHSIHSFMSQLTFRAMLLRQEWFTSHHGLVEIALMLFVLAQLVVIFFRAVRQQAPGLNPDLLVACALAAMLLPVQSNDYKLAILAGPVAILFSSLKDRVAALSQRLPAHAAIAVLSLAYSATLFPLSHKPPSLLTANACPTLLIMLLAVTMLSILLPPARGIGQPSPIVVAGTSKRPRK